MLSVTITVTAPYSDAAVLIIFFLLQYKSNIFVSKKYHCLYFIFWIMPTEYVWHGALSLECSAHQQTILSGIDSSLLSWQ